MQKLSATNFLAAYKRINAGYSRKAVFQLTCARGFGSNINDMVLAILYCLAHELQFQLGTNCWVSGKNKTWERHFVSFCTERDSQYPDITQVENLYTLKYALLWKVRHPFVMALNTIVTLRLRQRRFSTKRYLSRWGIAAWRWWVERKGKEFLPQHFLFPQLGIDGDIFHAKSVIARMILQPTAKMVDGHRAAVESLKPYIAVHVRKGDRARDRKGNKAVLEYRERVRSLAPNIMNVFKAEIEIPEYLEKIQSLAPNIKNIFIATDDYRAVSDFRELRPDLNIVTFCDKDKRGYGQQEFMKNPHQEKELAAFLVDLYYLQNADYFIGSSSNVSRIASLLREEGTSCSLDGGWHPW